MRGFRCYPDTHPDTAPHYVYPINPKADEILGKKAYKSVKDVPGEIDIAVFAVPAKFCVGAMEEVGEKGIPGAIMIPSGFAEVGETELQD